MYQNQTRAIDVITKDILIINKLGLHARAAAKLVKLSSSFQSSIDIEKDGQRVNSKSIMGVMMLAASCGSTVSITAEGDDQQAAIDAITDLIDRRFDEEE
jgi:phosphocarrier protein